MGPDNSSPFVPSIVGLVLSLNIYLLFLNIPCCVIILTFSILNVKKSVANCHEEFL